MAQAVRRRLPQRHVLRGRQGHPRRRRIRRLYPQGSAQPGHRPPGSRTRDRADVRYHCPRCVGTRRRGPLRARSESARLRSLHRNLREGRRKVALHQLDTHPVARRRVQRPCRGVHLGPDATSHRPSIATGDEVTEAPVAYPTSTALGRFGIAPIVDSPDPFVSSMPLAGLVNPVTGAPTIGPLAVLVDHAAGLVNHYRKTAGEWTLTSELALELTPDALAVVADHPDVAAIATARP